MRTSKSIKRLVIASSIIVSICLGGCMFSSAEGSLEKLKNDYETCSKELNELVVSLQDAYRLTKVKGLALVNKKSVGVIVVEKEWELNFYDKPPIKFSEFIKNLDIQEKDCIDRVLKIAKNIRVAYANLNEDGSCWIIMEGGGVLGNDLGYLYLGNKPIKSYENVHSYIPLDKEGKWFAIIY